MSNMFWLGLELLLGGLVIMVERRFRWSESAQLVTVGGIMVVFSVTTGLDDAQRGNMRASTAPSIHTPTPMTGTTFSARGG